MIIIFLIIGILVGAGAVWWIYAADKNQARNLEQTKKKEENLSNILELMKEEGEVSNREVQEKLGVTNSTAERYLAELEKLGTIEQVGRTGQNVIYKIKQ